jgi:hypothetical protein
MSRLFLQTMEKLFDKWNGYAILFFVQDVISFPPSQYYYTCTGSQVDRDTHPIPLDAEKTLRLQTADT